MPRPSRILLTEADPPESASVESDLVVILAALFCALICVVGLFAVTRCSCLRRSSSSAPNKGLRKKALNSLPRCNYDCVTHTSLGADCPVCLTGYAQGDLIRVLPRCRHGFHVACIDTWLRSHSSCPSCRQILVVPACRKCGKASDDSLCIEH